MKVRYVMIVVALSVGIGSSVSSVTIGADEAGAIGFVANYVLADPFTTASKVVAANALTTETAQQFKKQHRKAAILQAAQLLLNLAILPIAYTKGRESQEDLTFSLGFSLVGLVRAGVSLRDILRHMRYAKNADQLHALLQDPAFKKKLGVTDWTHVRNRRRLAEGVAFGTAATVGVAGAGVTLNSDEVVNLLDYSGPDDDYTVSKKTVETAGVIGVLSPAVIKPIISRLIRQKGSARGLEAAFDAAIKEKQAAAKAAAPARATASKK